MRPRVFGYSRMKLIDVRFVILSEVPVFRLIQTNSDATDQLDLEGKFLASKTQNRR